MKQYLILSAFLMLLLVGSSACKKTSTGPDGGGNQVVMTATVNGNAWSGIIPFTGNNNGYHDFSAGDSNSVIAIYYIQADTGTYPINGNTGDSCFATYDLHQTEYISQTNSGTIHFSKITASQVVGTFNFIATDPANDTVRITNGTFNIAL
ncbi:MAG TPA: DUF6252 family protein [Candidatus Kapabacteria bacterium]|nr:DUF6252 family protein [Candidatus Kapabacteria bacterium]